LRARAEGSSDSLIRTGSGKDGFATPRSNNGIQACLSSWEGSIDAGARPRWKAGRIVRQPYSNGEWQRWLCHSPFESWNRGLVEFLERVHRRRCAATWTGTSWWDNEQAELSVCELRARAEAGRGQACKVPGSVMGGGGIGADRRLRRPRRWEASAGTRRGSQRRGARDREMSPPFPKPRSILTYIPS